MDITFSPTPYRTVHVTATVPVDQVGKARRSIAAQVKPRGLGKRVTIREHVIGDKAIVFAIYRKGQTS